MKTLQRILLCSFCLTIGIISALGFRIWQVQTKQSKPFPTKKILFHLVPPSEALDGEVSLLTGEVLIQTRYDTGFKPVLVGQKIQQGDVVKTGKHGKISIHFLHIGNVMVSENTHIGFSDTIPQEFLIIQNSGIVLYTTINQQNNVITVRSLHSLCAVSGSVRVTTDDVTKKTLISVVSKIAKIAQVDRDNTTQIIQLQEKQTAVLDDNLLSIMVNN